MGLFFGSLVVGGMVVWFVSGWFEWFFGSIAFGSIVVWFVRGQYAGSVFL